jgi:dTDP-4-amino-4,6-dideoxygalactose transaminase
MAVVPFVDLRTQYRSIKAEIDAAVLGVLDSAQFVLGSEVQAFEREFAAYTGTTHAIGVNSGTSALHLAFLAAGVGPGDDVITTPHTFVATVAAIEYAGARAVYADIDPASFTLDPAALERALTPKTKAIAPVHLYGQCADMDPILDFAKRRGLLVIEDAAQAHGATYKGKPAGSMGHVGCFSFYPGKNLGAYGEGGAVVTSDPEIDKRVRMLRDWGQPQKYHHDLKGFNYRLEGIQGAILRVKLRHLPAWTAARRAAGRAYGEALASSPVAPPQVMPWGEHVFHVYAVRTAHREQLMKHLADHEVQSGIHYPIPVHLQKAYADPAFGAGAFPHAERAASEVVSLPMFPEITAEQIAQVTAAVKSFVA